MEFWCHPQLRRESLVLSFLLWKTSNTYTFHNLSNITNSWPIFLIPLPPMDSCEANLRYIIIEDFEQESDMISFLHFRNHISLVTLKYLYHSLVASHLLPSYRHLSFCIIAVSIFSNCMETWLNAKLILYTYLM